MGVRNAGKAIREARLKAGLTFSRFQESKMVLLVSVR